MKILSLNINGLISWIESKSYREIEKIDADVICLQETRTRRRLTTLSGYCHYFFPCEQDGLHGTMTLTKKEPLNVIYGFGEKILDAEGRVLTVEFSTTFVVNCYAPRIGNLERKEFRRRWDDALKIFVKNLLNKGKQVILCGDFNVLREEIDIYPENLREFLRAGHIFAGEIYPSNGLGISEGSSISPLLSNIILNGLQEHIYKSIGVWRDDKNFDYENGRMIRYVDDVIFTVRSENFGKKVIIALENFLSERGLTISVEKTFICPITRKFNFLSRSYWVEDEIFYSTPSDEAVGKFITELEQSVMRNIENKSQREIIRLLNRKLKGWAGYHRITDAKNSFRKIDAALHGILLKATFSKHPKMSHEKVIKKYWYKDADGKYIFALPNDKSVRLISISDIPLINYEPISEKMNPYTDAGYFESRTHEKAIQHITAKYRPIWNRQGGKCKYCGRFILPDQKRNLVPINFSAPISFENSAYVHEKCKENELDYIGYMENPHDLRETDVMRLLEEVARIREHRTHDKISYIKRKWLPGDTIWTHILLKRYFSICFEEKITLTFKQIEEIEGKKLRPESKKSEFWSEQKKSYKTIADTWKSEGYELENLDLENEKITLRRINPKSLLKIPEELTRQKLPADAIFELETHFSYVIDKYGLKFC